METGGLKSRYLELGQRAGTASFRLSEILGALSHALDMTEGQPEGHCLRCCWIGIHVGRAVGMDAEELGDLYYTLLLKDLGCSSNAARICELYLTDDIGFKRDFKTVDGSLSAALRFVFAKTGLESGLTERIRAIVNILRNGGEIARELIETRCHRGADIAAKLGFSERVQNGIRSLDEHWDGSGKPDRLEAGDIPRAANIALLAQVADVFAWEHGREAA
ncbi:MAG: metal-dependent phosphohydrolase, partial [Oricola sp.]|nr:metal-dependent phosphohydrolase [Oricola sp.]